MASVLTTATPFGAQKTRLKQQELRKTAVVVPLCAPACLLLREGRAGGEGRMGRQRDRGTEMMKQIGVKRVGGRGSRAGLSCCSALLLVFVGYVGLCSVMISVEMRQIHVLFSSGDVGAARFARASGSLVCSSAW